jgi:predicted transcriptional regulator
MRLRIFPELLLCTLHLPSSVQSLSKVLASGTYIMTVGEICNREVVITKRDASVLDAARLMKAHHVGDLVVVKEPDGQRMPVGILTDRDIALALADWPDRVAHMTVSDVMSTSLVTSHEGENLYDTLKKMQSFGIRRLPVVNATGGLEGVITFDDIIALLSEELTDLAKLVAKEQKRERQERVAR